MACIRCPSSRMVTVVADSPVPSTPVPGRRNAAAAGGGPAGRAARGQKCQVGGQQQGRDGAQHVPVQQQVDAVQVSPDSQDPAGHALANCHRLAARDDGHRAAGRPRASNSTAALLPEIKINTAVSAAVEGQRPRGQDSCCPLSWVYIQVPPECRRGRPEDAGAFRPGLSPGDGHAGKQVA